ncbi:MAG: ATP-binding protein, partial [Candidatus Korobacteraceae bacterium]
DHRRSSRPRLYVEGFPLTNKDRGRQTSHPETFSACARDIGQNLSDERGKLAAMRVSYRLESTLESVNQAEEMTTKVALQAGFCEEQAVFIAMAVREATVNAILHGNGYDPAKKVDLQFEQTDANLVVTVRDQGRGLDPNSLPDPLAPENLLKQSGRGIFLIRSFMDEVFIRPVQPGTEIRMIKHLHSPGGESKEETKCRQ